MRLVKRKRQQTIKKGTYDTHLAGQKTGKTQISLHLSYSFSPHSSFPLFALYFPFHRKYYDTRSAHLSHLILYIRLREQWQLLRYLPLTGNVKQDVSYRSVISQCMSRM